MVGSANDPSREAEPGWPGKMTVRTNCYFFSITIEILSTYNIEISTPGGGGFLNFGMFRKEGGSCLAVPARAGTPRLRAIPNPPSVSALPDFSPAPASVPVPALPGPPRPTGGKTGRVRSRGTQENSFRRPPLRSGDSGPDAWGWGRGRGSVSGEWAWPSSNSEKR